MGSNPLYTVDDNKKRNPRLPFIEVWLGGVANPILLSRPAEISPPLEGPSYVTTFNYKRKTQNFCAGDFTLGLFDPTFTLVDMLNYSLNQDAQSQAPLGQINFSFGYFDNTGTFYGIGTPYSSGGGVNDYMRGVVTKMRASVTRRGLNLILTGTDLDMTATVNAVEFSSLNAYASYSVQSLFTSAFELLFANTGVTLETVWMPETLGADLVCADLLTFIQDNQTQQFRWRNSTGQMQIKHIAQLLESFFLYRNFPVKVVLQGTRFVNGVPTTRIEIRQVTADVMRRASFYMNTTKDGFGNDNFSDVSSFNVSLDGFSPALLGLVDAVQELSDPDTREWSTYGKPVSTSPTLGVGEQMCAPGTDVSPWQAPGLNMTAQMRRRSTPRPSSYRQLMENAQVMSPGEWEQMVAQQHHILSTIPLQASMALVYPDASKLEPFTMVDVLMPLPSAKPFPFSGVFMITDVSFDMSPGSYTGNVSLQKIGPISKPDHDAPSEMSGSKITETPPEEAV